MAGNSSNFRPLSNSANCCRWKPRHIKVLICLEPNLLGIRAFRREIMSVSLLFPAAVAKLGLDAFASVFAGKRYNTWASGLALTT